MMMEVEGGLGEVVSLMQAGLEENLRDTVTYCNERFTFPLQGARVIKCCWGKTADSAFVGARRLLALWMHLEVAIPPMISYAVHSL